MATPQEITAAEAAARLGVQKGTLYSYVSRGLIHRRVADDGRTSRFDADEIESFRSRRRRTADGELDTVISTALTRVRDGEVRVRGHDLTTLVARGKGYEDVAALLWGTDAGSWEPASKARRAILALSRALPDSTPAIDRLRMAVAAASAVDPLRNDLSPAAIRAAGRSLIATMIDALPLQGSSASAGTIAERLWPRLTARRATRVRRAALDGALALLVDHGIAASTFGARIAASVRADPYSIVITGLGVIGGTLHGAASRGVHETLAAAHDSGDAAAAIGTAHRRDAGIAGFGHPIHSSEDPRFTALGKLVRDGWSDDPRYETVIAVQDLVQRRSAAVANVDLALGALTWLAGMAADAGEAIYAVSRTAGWLAHAIEEYEEPPLRFRPRARYVGEA